MAAELDRSGLVDSRVQRSLKDTIRRMADEGILTSAGPGVFVAQDEQRPPVLARAATRAFPDAVVTGRAAAALTFWPDLPVPEVVLARAHRTQPRHRIRFERRHVPTDLRLARPGLMLTDPALTALDLCRDVGGDGIDQVLRQRAAGLDQLWEALRLTADRPGNNQRRRLLIESRAEPWSRAERLLHELLRGGGVTGWAANTAIHTPGGRYLADVAFRAERLILEVEGVAFHSGPARLHSDRTRQNELTRAGWRVLRIDWQMLIDDPERVLEVIRGCLRLAGSGSA